MLFCIEAISATAELEKHLAKAEKERDDLARDVEALCMQSGSSIFDGSMVLSERIFSAEKELSRVKAQVGHKHPPHSATQNEFNKILLPALDGQLNANKHNSGQEGLSCGCLVKEPSFTSVCVIQNRSRESLVKLVIRLRCAVQLALVTEERNNLREDLWGHKDSRRLVESSYIKERDRADKLEKELQFYQTQSARAMADRDKVEGPTPFEGHKS